MSCANGSTAADCLGVGSATGSNGSLHRYIDENGYPLPNNSLGAASAPPRVIQSGGNKINNSTANTLNEIFETNYSRRDWGRALEKMKKDLGLRGDHHGRILSDGSYVNQAGERLGYIDDYLP